MRHRPSEEKMARLGAKARIWLETSGKHVITINDKHGLHPPLNHTHVHSISFRGHVSNKDKHYPYYSTKPSLYIHQTRTIDHRWPWNAFLLRKISTSFKPSISASQHFLVHFKAASALRYPRCSTRCPEGSKYHRTTFPPPSRRLPVTRASPTLWLF